MSETKNKQESRLESENDQHSSRLESLIRDAKDLGCEAALRKHNHDVGYLTDEKRASYIDVLNIRDDMDVLEIGASMGQHSRLIAKKCKQLEALEIISEQAEFGELWCKESGLENVHFSVGGGDGILSYKDNTFDLVIMNYVLEWSAGSNASNVEAFHLQLLKEIKRVLKKNGTLFLSTKNRFGLRLVLGGVDEHYGIQFGSALPRTMGRGLLKLLKKGKPKGHLYSRQGLEKKLFEAGFSRIEMFISFPDARWPEVILPFDRDRLRELKKLDPSKYSKKDQLYLKLPRMLKKQVSTSHTMIAKK